MMATGSKAKGLFSKTVSEQTSTEKQELITRKRGRPRATTPSEPYEKVTVCIYKSQILWLDKVALAYREKADKRIYRAELIRALIGEAMKSIDPANLDEKFVNAVDELVDAAL